MALNNLLAAARPNPILEVASAAMSHPNPVRMWFGESDLATPAFICEAAQASMSAGQTFYAPRRGIPELRKAIANYLEGLYEVSIDVERITVTSSGMSAIMVAVQAVASRGGNIVVVAPIWPNITNAIAAIGAECRHVRLEQGDNTWHLNLDTLFAATDKNTRAIFLASPGNPTGWICSEAEQKEILQFCSTKGIYLIADEVYQRLVLAGGVAPSFLTALDPHTAPLMIVNSFSKMWAMSGWRLGWLVHPTKDAHCIGELNAVNNTGAATFVQYAGLRAIQEGESFISYFQEYCRRGYELVHTTLRDIKQVKSLAPAGAMYSFFSVHGVSDSVQFAKRLALKTGVGLAPGPAFGENNEGFFRLCYALDTPVLAHAMKNLKSFIEEERV